MRRRLAAALALGLASPAAAQMPSAQPLSLAPPVIITAFDDWQLVCPDPATCRAEPRAPLAEGLTLALVAEGGTAVLVLRGPLGLLLGEGVRLRVDGAETGRLAFLTCEIDGCIAPARLDGPLGPALRRGGAVELTMWRRDGTEISANLSLIGISAAQEALLQAAPN